MDSKGISKLDLKRRNRRQILFAIRQAGQLARVDIAAQLSLTRAAVTIITNQMIAQNILEDLNSPLPVNADEPKKKGRKKTMIRIKPTYKYALGAVINAQNLSVGISNLANEVVGKANMALTDQTTYKEIVSFIVSASKRLMKRNSLTAQMVLGLGIGVVPSRQELMQAKEADGQIVFDTLCSQLEKDLGMPVCAECAVNLYAMANTDYSSETGAAQLLLYSGKTYHCAVVRDHASGACTAENVPVERMVIRPAGAKAEGYPDGSVYAEMSPETLLSRIQQATGRTLTAQEVNEAYEQGDEEIIACLRAQLDQLAILIYNLCLTYRADRMTMQGFDFCEAARDYVRTALDALGGNDMKVVYSRITPETAFLAGCCLAAEKQFYELGGMQQGETAV